MSRESVIEELSRKIEAEKQRLLFERFCERVQTYEPINLDEEVQRRFPRIKAERYPGETRYYWNDGTKDGLLLITFIDPSPEDMWNTAKDGKFTAFNFR